jgi:hypothetical protein
MKNLIFQREEKLEDLPEKATFRDKPFEGYTRWNYPWKRVTRFLHSRKGRSWDSVVSEFVRLEWVPVEYRNFTRLCRHVKVNTFLKDNKVYFYEDRRYRSYNNEQSVIDYGADLFFVHPVTKTLCFYRHVDSPRSPEKLTGIHLGDYHQLLKIKGIWYDVRAVNVTDIQRKHFPPRQRLLSNDGAGLYDIRWVTPTLYIYRPCVIKRQLSSKELKKYGIKND